ncbi:MAG: hypothetical protein HDP34_01915 [Clostridia bacterium]|nr:hypothetical protein [Clostridia bacterium]
MKKRILATILVGAVAATTVMGLAACGGASIPKGEQVTEEAWKNAFDKTTEFTNYTLNSSSDLDINLKGTVTAKGSKKVEVKSTVSTSSNQLFLYDKDGHTSYAEYTTESKGKSTADDEESNYSRKTTNKQYYTLCESNSLIDTYWRASYSKSETKTEEGENYTENYWYANESLSFSSNQAAYVFNDYFYDSNDKDTAKRAKLANLYDKFKYSGGVYKATLYYYQEVSEDYNLSDLLECKVTVSIKDGCAVGYGIKINVKNANLYLKDYYDIKYSYKLDAKCGITDVKSTDVSKKATKDITKVIDKAKADKEKD